MIADVLVPSDRPPGRRLAAPAGGAPHAAAAHAPEEAVTESPVPGRALVSWRALADIVRAAVVGSYGVIDLSDRRRLRRALRAVGVPPRGMEVSLRDGIARAAEAIDAGAARDVLARLVETSRDGAGGSA